MKKKKVPQEISEHYRKLAQKSVESRHKAILNKAKLETKIIHS